MTLLRPVRRVLDHEGREWEVYVSRTVVPEWRPAESSSHAGPGGIGALLDLLSFVTSIFTAVLLPLGRMLVGLPRAWLRGRRSRTFRIEAISYWPARESRAWDADAADVDQALVEICAGLRRGQTAQPSCATFVESREG